MHTVQSGFSHVHTYIRVSQLDKVHKQRQELTRHSKPWHVYHNLANKVLNVYTWLAPRIPSHVVEKPRYSSKRRE